MSIDQNNLQQKTFGVALSGGGYRATAFHIGTLKRLHSLGLLSRIKVLSTISGGSITGAAYCIHKGDFASFEEEMIKMVTTKSVVRYGLTSWLFIRGAGLILLQLGLMIYLYFTGNIFWSFLLLCLLIFLILRYQFCILPLGRIIENAYNKFIFNGAALSSLCSEPELAIGSTNMQTLRHFTFSKRKMEDSLYAHYTDPILFDGAEFPLARAVMASSCVPFAFTPVTIEAKYFKNPQQFGKVNPKLIDGGIYDNQGIHKLTQNNSSYRCDIVLVSDAGNKLPFEKSYNNTFTLLLRTVEIFMGRIKNFQMAQSIYNPQEGREIAYQSIGWDLDNCVKGFYSNLLQNKINPSVLAMHGLRQDWLGDPKRFKAEIIFHMEEICCFEEISKTSLNENQLKAIRNIGTSLSKIPEQLVKDMITHAEILTEVQLRLYCPTLFKQT
jgi:NTE family protein